MHAIFFDNYFHQGNTIVFHQQLSMSSPIVDINNDNEAKAASLVDAAEASSSAGHKSVLFFYAEWHAPSAAGGPFDMVVKALAAQSGDGVKIYRVLAEEAPTLSQKVRAYPVVYPGEDWVILSTLHN